MFQTEFKVLCLFWFSIPFIVFGKGCVMIEWVGPGKKDSKISKTRVGLSKYLDFMFFSQDVSVTLETILTTPTKISHILYCFNLACDVVAIKKGTIAWCSLLLCNKSCIYWYLSLPDRAPDFFLDKLTYIVESLGNEETPGFFLLVISLPFLSYRPTYSTKTLIKRQCIGNFSF